MILYCSFFTTGTNLKIFLLNKGNNYSKQFIENSYDCEQGTRD